MKTEEQSVGRIENGKKKKHTHTQADKIKTQLATTEIACYFMTDDKICWNCFVSVAWMKSCEKNK